MSFKLKFYYSIEIKTHLSADEIIDRIRERFTPVNSFFSTQKVDKGYFGMEHKDKFIIRRYREMYLPIDALGRPYTTIYKDNTLGSVKVTFKPTKTEAIGMPLILFLLIVGLLTTKHKTWNFSDLLVFFAILSMVLGALITYTKECKATTEFIRNILHEKKNKTIHIS